MLILGLVIALLGACIMLVVPFTSSLKSSSIAYGFCILVVGILYVISA